MCRGGVCTHENRYLLRLEVSDPLELQSQMAVSHLTWVLGLKLGSSGRAYMFLITEPSLMPPTPTSLKPEFSPRSCSRPLTPRIPGDTHRHKPLVLPWERRWICTLTVRTSSSSRTRLVAVPVTSRKELKLARKGP